MDNRIVIKSIHITNFRSIRNVNINLSKMNIFVGLNDVGKSNILKALNLFFNNNTDYDVEFDFDKDFSYLFPKKSHSAKEIKIELKLIIPNSFKNSGEYTWTKKWRREGLCWDKIVDTLGNIPTERSRIPITLHRIKFRYVPAVKSRDFYRFLLSELYLTAAASLNSPLVESTKEFASVIQQYTEQIHNEVSEKIGIESQLTIPADMTEMFKTLIFMTNGADEEMLIPLDMRGDGIQSRHIPIILKYLADEDQKASSRGSVNITSIWGYEEPENGIELLKSFEVAESFHEYCQEIQLFITTHSPAFYIQESHNDAKVFYVKKIETKETFVSESLNSQEIGQSMGLMPLVAPYISKMEKQLNELLNRNNDLLLDIPTIFVEGITDKQYIELAIKVFSPRLSVLLQTEQLRIYTKEGEGGCDQIINWVHSWIYKGNNSKTLALFDKDTAGIQAHNELVASKIYKESKNNRADYIPPTDSIIKVFNKKISFEYEIEHLLSPLCWKKIKNLGYTAERSSAEINSMLGNHADKNRTALEVLKELIPDDDIRETILLYEPEDNSKSKILGFVASSNEEEKKEYLSGFEKLVRKLEDRFLDADTQMD